MTQHLFRIAELAFNRPLLIEPEAASIAASVLLPRIGAETLVDLDGDAEKPEASAFVGTPVMRADGRYAGYRMSDGTAIAPMRGKLVNRGAYIGASSGLTSYEGMQAVFAAMRDDPSVRAVVLDIDSPGGEAAGAFETAAALAALSAVKPVTAMVNAVCCSAAYLVAAAATEIVLTQTGSVGSVGVVFSRPAVLQDLADAAVALGFGMQPEAAIESFAPMRQITDPVRTSAAASAVVAQTNGAAIASFARIVALAVEGEALARRDFVDRDAAEASRSTFTSRVEAETESLAGTIRLAQLTRSSADSAIAAMSDLHRAVIDYLTTVSLDLAPRVTVETNASLPSRVWAWQLYGDPGRARELSRGNRVRRPAFMPLRFRALAPASLTVTEP